MAEAKERSRASQKKGACGGIRFEAEATAWLKSAGIESTNDDPKYTWANVPATIKAILCPSGYVQNSAEAGEGATVRACSPCECHSH